MVILLAPDRVDAEPQEFSSNPMAHIVIDARKYSDFGIGTYVQNLSRSLALLSSSHRFSLLTTPTDFSHIVLPTRWQKQAVRYKKYSPGELFLLGREVRRMGADLLHEPHYTLPLGLRGRSVVTIHDLIHLKFPQYFTVFQRAYARSVLQHVARNAGAIITGSEHAKREVVETLRADEQKVHAIYHGVQPGFARVRDQAKLREFRERFGLSNPYILYVGSIKPHKNIPTLLKAFGAIATSCKELDLTFVGDLLSRNVRLSALAQSLGIAGRIRDLGHLSTEDLVAAYSAAEMLVLPSLHEGFGFTVVEAMACDTPVIAANTASLPEVVGNAGVIFDASEPETLQDALRTVLAEPAMRKQLVERGRENLRRFSWDRTARETLRVYELVLDRQ